MHSDEKDQESLIIKSEENDKEKEEEVEVQNEDVKTVEEIDDEKARLKSELEELNNKYLRLYAEFENYKKRVNKDKEELKKYSNESLISELLAVIDNLELALKHASNSVSEGLVQGVEITLKELNKILEKFGLSVVDAEGKAFDPKVHHAMTQIERDDIDENIVVEEYRKGYMLKDKVLRPSLVAVSKKPEVIQEKEKNMDKTIEEESKNG